MNTKHVLSISLLLVTLPALAERCTNACTPASRDNVQLITRSDAEAIVDTQNDLAAGFVLVGTQIVDLPKAAGSIDWSGETVKIVTKEALKALANHHVPADLAEFNLDLPGLPDFTVINTDQAVEVLHAAYGTWKNAAGDSVAVRQAIINTLVRTYGREKALQILKQVVGHVCPEGSCPLPDSITKHWATKFVLGGAARYTLDYLWNKYVPYFN